MPHILLVDDDEDILSLLTSFFRKHAHTVTTARDGAAMFAALDAHPIDLVVLDVMLQNEDGFSLCRRLRAMSAVPVIMLTAMADHTDRVVGLELGADDYLTKPFDQRELLARVKAVLRRTTETAAAPLRGVPPRFSRRRPARTYVQTPDHCLSPRA
jgi:two-component system, OmpR family, response regulator